MEIAGKVPYCQACYGEGRGTIVMLLILKIVTEKTNEVGAKQRGGPHMY